MKPKHTNNCSNNMLFYRSHYNYLYLLEMWLTFTYTYMFGFSLLPENHFGFVWVNNLLDSRMYIVSHLVSISLIIYN